MLEHWFSIAMFSRRYTKCASSPSGISGLSLASLVRWNGALCCNPTLWLSLPPAPLLLDQATAIWWTRGRTWDGRRIQCGVNHLCHYGLIYNLFWFNIFDAFPWFLICFFKDFISTFHGIGWIGIPLSQRIGTCGFAHSAARFPWFKGSTRVFPPSADLRLGSVPFGDWFATLETSMDSLPLVKFNSLYRSLMVIMPVYVDFTEMPVYPLNITKFCYVDEV